MLYPSNAIQDKRWKLVFSLGFNGCHPTLNAEWLCGILTNSSSFPASVACQSRVLRQSRHDKWQLNRKTRATGYFGAISVLHLWHWAIYSTYSTDIDRNKILSRNKDVGILLLPYNIKLHAFWETSLYEIFSSLELWIFGWYFPACSHE